MSSAPHTTAIRVVPQTKPTQGREETAAPAAAPAASAHSMAHDLVGASRDAIHNAASSAKDAAAVVWLR